MMAINEHLKLTKIDEKNITLADGSQDVFDVVGSVIIKFENRTAMCSAIVLPGNAEVLLGAIPMEEIDVLIDLKE
jgi:predicted aspartyl protease